MTTADHPVVYDATRIPAHFEVAVDASDTPNPDGTRNGYIAFGDVKVAEGRYPADATHEAILTGWLQRLARIVDAFDVDIDDEAEKR